MMNAIDFLSSSPQIFILERQSNRSNFGGFFSLIYTIIFLIISLYYLISYYNEDNYSIQYIYQEKTLTDEDTLKMVESERFNPYFNFCVSFNIKAEKEIKDRFGIRRYNNILFSQVNTSTCQNIKITDLNWMIVYDCLDKNDTECEINPYLLHSETISLNMYFNGFVLDHQNKTSPLYRLNGDQVSHWFRPSFDIYNPSRQVHTWNNIRYKEQKGFFSIFKKEEDNDYIGLKMKSYDYSEMSGLKGDKQIFFWAYDVKSRTSHNYKVIGRLKFDVDFYHYDEYKRIPKNFWDTVANICSLSMTILKTLFFTFVNYFSNDFDNYKIMQKILNNSNFKQEKKIMKKEEINEDIRDLNREENLIEKSNDNQNLLIINDENENEDDKIIIDNGFNFGNENFLNLNFFDFLFNTFYDGKCCKIEKKKFIEKCKEIISKYYSMEYIISNQIILENLLKDYRWNDPRLNNINNNELISQLKNIIYPYNNI